MFGLSLSHLILFGVIALIFVGPEQLPEVARTIGRILNELRRATQDFQSQFTGQFKEEQQSFHELKQQISAPEMHVTHDYEKQHENAHVTLPAGADPVSDDGEKKS